MAFDLLEIKYIVLLVTYNSKRNFTKMTLTYSGEYYGDSSVVYNHYYKYNKAGDCIEYKYETAEGYAVMQYIFNELGETIGKEQTESTGGVSLV